MQERATFAGLFLLNAALLIRCGGNESNGGGQGGFPAGGGSIGMAGTGGAGTGGMAVAASGGMGAAGSSTGGTAGNPSIAGTTSGGAMNGTGATAGAAAEGGAPAAGSEGDAGAGAEGPAELLSETGLYADITTETLADGVRWYEPQFELWSDGATKNRWIYLPEGTQIDTSDIDNWQFPAGTKIWKEFTRDELRIETRLIEKLPPEREDEVRHGWLMVAYIWNEDQSDAVAAPMGLENAKGTDHDVPDYETCQRCHDMRREKPLGVSAVQLSHEGEGVTLDALIADGLLSEPPEGPLTVPGDDTERSVLGYLHANCGHCHRADAPANERVSTLKMWLESAALGSVEETEAYIGLVNQHTESADGSMLMYRVTGGDPENSELFRRITTRGEKPQMPPVGSEIVDESAVGAVRTWIEGLPPPEEP